jgi:hypothetical protein
MFRKSTEMANQDHMKSSVWKSTIFHDMKWPTLQDLCVEKLYSLLKFRVEFMHVFQFDREINEND